MKTRPKEKLDHINYKKLSYLEKLFVNYKGGHPELVDWGEPQGEEIW